MRKQLFFIVVLLVMQLHLLAVTKTWLGTAADKKWSTSANWSPSGAPLTTDDVLVNISDSIDVDFVSGTSLTVNSIKIANNATVVFSYKRTSSTTLTRTLIVSATGTGSTPYGCEIETGSHLKINTTFVNTSTGGRSSNFIFSLTGAPGVTGLINGILSFSGYLSSTGGGTPSCDNKLETTTGALAYAVCNVFGKIQYFANTGNTITSSTTMTMKDGSFFELYKAGGVVPGCTWETNSTLSLLGITNGLPVFSTTTLGNFIYDCPNQSSNLSFSDNLSFNNVQIINTGANPANGINIANNATANRTWTVNGNFTTNANTLFRIINTSVTTGSGTLNLKGNFINNGTFTAANTNGANANFRLNGTSQQSISGNGTISGVIKTYFDNPAGFQLLNDITWGGATLDHNNGIVNNNTFTFTIPYNAPIYNTATPTSTYGNLTSGGYINFGAENAYFIGKLSRSNISSGTLTEISFPVGSSSLHRPVILLANSDSYTVEYKRINPWTLGTTMQAGLDHTSSLEYWDITSSGAAAAAVGLTWYDPNSGGVSNLSTLRVARFNGSQWNNEGNQTVIGTAGSNGIIFSNSVTSFGPFTLASTNNENPLPLVDINLSLVQNGSNTTARWTTIDDREITNYQLQQKMSNGQFTTIGTIASYRLAGNNVYSYNLLSNRNLTQYRIKAISVNGAIAYSNMVLFTPKNHIDFILLGNVIHSNMQYHSHMQNAELVITNINGKKVIQKSIISGVGSTDISHLRSGLYVVAIVQNRRIVSTSRILKQ
jgi:hypothetical protein